MATFEILAHTADTGIEVRAGTFADLAAGAARAMAALQFEPGGGVGVSVPVRVSGDSPEEVFVAWLEELIVVAESGHLALSEFAVEETVGGGLRGIARGTDADRVSLVGAPIKAVTHHGLVVEPTADGWHARVFFDV